MKTTIKYEGDKTDNLIQAIEDCREYLTEEKFEKLCGFLHETYKSKGIRTMIRQAYYFCAIAGIEGLPVRAIMKYSINCF